MPELLMCEDCVGVFWDGTLHLCNPRPIDEYFAQPQMHIVRIVESEFTRWRRYGAPSSERPAAEMVL